MPLENLIYNTIAYVILTAGASLLVIVGYAFIQFASGNRRYAVDFIIRNLWIPVVAACIVAFASNIDNVARFLHTNDLSLFSYDYAIYRVDTALKQVKTFLYNYIRAVGVAATAISIANFIIDLLTLGVKTIVDAIFPVANVAASALFAPAYMWSYLVLYLTIMYWLLVIMKGVSITLLSAGSITLPIPRVRRLGITLFILGVLLTYGLPYIVNTSLENSIGVVNTTGNLNNVGVLYAEGPPYSLLNFSVSSPFYKYYSYLVERNIYRPTSSIPYNWTNSYFYNGKADHPHLFDKSDPTPIYTGNGSINDIKEGLAERYGINASSLNLIYRDDSYYIFQYRILDHINHGYAVYQLNRYGKGLFIALEGNYTLNSISISYLTYNAEELAPVKFNVSAGLGKFFIKYDDMEKYLDDLAKRYYPTRELQEDFKKLLMEHYVVNDGELWYVSYPYNYTFFNASKVMPYLLGDSANITYLMHNGTSIDIEDEVSYTGTAKFMHYVNDTYSYFLINSTGKEYGELDINIFTISHYPGVIVNSSSSKYVNYSISISRVNGSAFTDAMYWKYLTQPYLTPKDWMEKIYNDFKNTINITALRKYTWSIYRYSNWNRTIEYVKNSSELFNEINNTDMPLLAFYPGNDSKPTRESMYQLYNYLSNLRVDYDKNYSIYLIHIHAYVKKHVRKIDHYINLLGSYNISSKNITVYWNGYSATYFYDNITSIGNDTITFTYENKTYTVQVNATASVNKSNKKIIITWNGLTIKKHYDELISKTHDYIEYYTIKYIPEYLKILIDPTPTNWHKFAFTGINTAAEPITKYLDNKNIFAMMNSSSILAYNTILFLLLLFAGDGIAGMFGGVSGIGYLGGKLYDKIFKSYIMQQLGLAAAIGRTIHPASVKGYRTSFMNIPKFKNWWKSLIARHGLLGHAATGKLAQQLYGRKIGELTFWQKYKVARMMIRSRGGVLKRSMLTTALITSMIGRKLVHYAGFTVGWRGYIHALRDLVGATHIKREIHHPRYTDTKLAKTWRTLEKLEQFSLERGLQRGIIKLKEWIEDKFGNIMRLARLREVFTTEAFALMTNLPRGNRLLPVLTNLQGRIQDAMYSKFLKNINRRELKKAMEVYRDVKTGSKSFSTLSSEEKSLYEAANRWMSHMKRIRDSRVKMVDMNALVNSYKRLMLDNFVKEFNIERMVWRGIRNFIKDEEKLFREHTKVYNGEIKHISDAYRFNVIQALRKMRDTRNKDEFNFAAKTFKENAWLWRYVSKRWNKIANDNKTYEAIKDYLINNTRLIVHAKKIDDAIKMVGESKYNLVHRGIDSWHSVKWREYRSRYLQAEEMLNKSASPIEQKKWENIMKAIERTPEWNLARDFYEEALKYKP